MNIDGKFNKRVLENQVQLESVTHGDQMEFIPGFKNDSTLKKN